MRVGEALAGQALTDDGRTQRPAAKMAQKRPLPGGRG
jgi:hypothetical protein